MTLSAAFTVEGDANPAPHHVAYGSTVNLAMTSPDGAVSIVWEIMACSDPDEPIPSIAQTGATTSFVFPADSGDTLGRTFLVRCTATNQIRGADGAYQQAIEYAVIGAENSNGELPIVPGEKNYRHGTHGWAPEINRALNNTGGGGGGGGSGGGWTDDGSVVRLTTTGDSVAIGTASLSGSEKLRVIGNSRFEQVSASSGNPKLFYVAGATHTALTSGSEVIDVDFALDRAVQHNTGAVTTQRSFVVRAPTYSFVGSSTITDAATLAVTAAPTAGTNATITNAYALWVQAGAVRIGALGAGVMFTTSTGVVSRLAYGTGLQVLRMNTGATALEFASVSNMTAPSNPSDDGKAAIASGGNLTYALITNANISSSAQIAITKLADIATDHLLGRDTAGTGSPEALTVGGGIEFTGAGGIQRSAISGDITVAAGSGTAAITAGVIVDADINASAAIALSKLASQAALTVVANATGSSAVPTAVAAASDGQVFLRSGTTLVFGTIGATSVTDGTLTLAKFANISALSVLGNGTNSSAVPTALTAATDGDVMRRSGTSVAFGAPNFAAQNVTTTGYFGGNDNSAVGGTGDASTFRAGDATGVSGTRTGGALTLRSGTGGNVTDAGNVSLLAGTYNLVGYNKTTPLLTFGDAALATVYLRVSSAGTLSFRAGSGQMGVMTPSTFELSSQPLMQFALGVANPTLKQELDTAATVTGDTFTIAAQDCSGTTTVTGGAMLVRAGDCTGTSGTRTGGALTLRAGDGGSTGTYTGGALTIRSGNGSVTANVGNVNILAGTNSLLSWNINHSNSCGLGSASAPTWIDADTVIHFALNNNEQMQMTSSGIRFLTNDISWAAGQVNPTIGQLVDTSASTTGDTLTVYAQDCSGTTSVTAGALTVRGGDATGASGTRNGGALTLRSGSGATSSGKLTLQRGTTPFLELANVSSGNVLSLLRTAGTLTSTQMPANTGDGVIYLAAATTAPTTGTGVGGAIIYTNSKGEFVTKSSSTGDSAGQMMVGDGTIGVSFKAGGATQDLFKFYTGVGGTPSTISLAGSYIDFDSDNSSGNDYSIRMTGTTFLGMSRISSTANLAVFSSGAINWQSGDNIMFIANRVAAPTGNPVGGGFLYVESGALKFRGSSGTITIVAMA